MRITDSDVRNLTDPEALGPSALRDLIAMHDPLGFMSISFTADPTERAGERPGWDIDIRNRLRELTANLREAGPRDLAQAVESVVNDGAESLDMVLAPGSAGIGRVLFVPLSGGSPVFIALQLPVAARLVVEDDVFLRPLLSALEQGRPGGVIVTSFDGIEVHDWRLGRLDAVKDLDASLRPAGHARTSTDPDRLDARRDREWSEFAHTAGTRIAALAGEQAWERLLVVGHTRTARPLIEALPPELRVHHSDHSAEAGDLAHIAAQAFARDTADNAARVGALIRERVAQGGAATLGLAETLTALNERRVKELVLDAEQRWSGRVGEDGLLATAEQEGAGALDTRLGERMIESALASGALVDIHEHAAGTLGHADGVGALLRW